MGKKLDELTEQFEAAQKRMQQEGEAALREAFSEVFAAHPQLLAIRWEQYTPYFNDGEPCTFRVHGSSIKFQDPNGPVSEDRDEDDDSDEDGFRDWSEWSEKYYSEQGKPYPQGFGAAYRDVQKIFRAVPDELMLATFDDHVQVTATRDGIRTEECSHD